MRSLVLGALQIMLAVQAAQGAVVGTVRDAQTHRPIEGAEVALSALDRATSSDSAGHYNLRDVPAGPNQITVRFIGYAQRSLQAIVPSEGELEINVWLLPDPVPIPAVDVLAAGFSSESRGVGAPAYPDRDLSSAEIRNNPLLAEPDALQALSGGEVFLRPESPSGVQIRGGASDETAYLLDGIPVFNPYHAAGMASGWNPDALSNLHLSSAAPSLGYPYALAGTVEAATRTPGSQVRAQGSVSTLQSRATFEGPLGKGGVGYLLSLRSGVPDRMAPKDEGTYMKGDVGDWLAKMEAPAFGGRVSLLGYANENDLSTAAAMAAVDGSSQSPTRNDFEWSSASIGAQWRRVFTRTAIRVLGWNALADAGSVWAARSGPLNIATGRRDKGFLASVQHNSARATTIAEIRVEQSRSSYRVESDSTGGPSLRVEATRPLATAVARHSRALDQRLELGLGGFLTVTGGGPYLGPNAQLIWKASNQVTLSGSYARTHQFFQSLRNAESVVGNVFPVDLYVGAGAKGVPVARCDQGVVAAEYRPSGGVRVGVQAYQRHSNGLLLVAPWEDEPFATGAVAVGSENAQGITADAALTAPGYNVVASYGLQFARLAYGGGSYVPESAARHLLEGGVIVFPTATASIRVGAAAAMGRRTTSVTDGFEWEACNLLDKGCEFGGSPRQGGGSLGATALPAYFRVDLGVRKLWRLGIGGRAASFALFGTVTNILGRKNMLTYAPDVSTGKPVGVEMRPLAPLVVGLDWDF